MLQALTLWKQNCKTVLGIAGLATAYLVTGSLAMLLAVPPSPAAPFWPPAGFALMAMLTCGRVVAPGVLLGSLMLHLYLSYERDAGLTAAGVLLSLGIGLGAALQAMVGASLVRRWVGWPSPLLSEREIFGFMSAGPVSCLINAVWANVLLCLVGGGWSDLPFNVAVWWVGDSIGTLVVPMMLLPFMGPVGDHWRARRQTVTLPMAVAATLTVGFFAVVRGQDHRSFQFQLETDVQRLARRLQEQVSNNLDVMHLLAEQASLNGRWSSPHLPLAAESALSRKTDLSSVGFLAVLPHSERAEFESQLRHRAGPNRGLMEFDKLQQVRPAQVRDHYVVNEWCVPNPVDRGIFGLDIASDPQCQAVLERAGQTRLPAAAAGIPLWPGGHPSPGSVVVFVPVFSRRAPLPADSPRPLQPSGYLATVLDVQRMVDRLSAELTQTGLRLRLMLDGMPSPAESASASLGNPELSATATVMLADVTGRVTLLADPACQQAFRSWPAWASLAAGLLGTALLGMLLLGLTGRAVLTAAQVGERTAELAEREEMFRLLAEATQDAIGIASTDRRVLYISPAFFRMTGWTLEDIRRTDYRSRCHAEDLPAVERAREANLAGLPTRVEWRCLRADGSYFWMETSATPILGPEQQVERIVTSSRDISARKAAEQALRDGQQRLRLALQAGKMGTWEWDVTTGALLWDEQEAALFGLTVTQLTRTDADFFERIHPEDAPRLLETLDECRRLRNDFETEFRIRRSDGQIRWLAARGRYDYDLTGRAVRMTGVNFDITASRQAAEALRQAHEFTRRLIDSSLDMIIAVDDQRRITEFNRAAEKTFGYRRDELLGRSVDLLYANPSDGYRIHSQSLRTGGVVVEIQNRRRTGEEFPCLLSASVLRDAHGQLLGMMGVSRDVTQLKRSEEQLQQTLAELARSNAELAAFASVAGHDLQEPLRTIAGSVKLLARRYSDKLGPDAERFIEFAVQGAERMQRMIADLLEYSRLGSRGLRRESVDLQVTAAGVLADLQAALTESRARVEVGPLPVVIADAAQISRVLLNFLSNALKFRAPERPLLVRIAAERVSAAWRVSVSDNGIGIASQHAGRLFTLFQRLHPAHQYPGTGMGLAACKKIVEQHGGRIGLCSQPDQGSTFWAEIPDPPAKSYNPINGIQANSPFVETIGNSVVPAPTVSTPLSLLPVIP